MTKKMVALIGAMTLAFAACGGDSEPAGGNGVEALPVEVGPADAGNGAKVYDSTCVACHGTKGTGIQGLGKPMPGSEFIEGLSDAELATFIEEGRSADHPDNTTGVDMPPLGGNNNLNEQDLVDVVAYIRSL